MKLLLATNYSHVYKAKAYNSVLGLHELFFLCLLILTSHANHAHAEGNKIVKWKDANGVIHYGDKMPAQEAGRSNSVLNNQGTVIKTNEPFNFKVNSVEIDRRSVEQERQDKALLASYTSTEEIDLAEKRNLKSDETALLSLNQSLADSKSSLLKIQEKFSGKKISPLAAEDAQNYQDQITKTKSQIITVQNSINQTKARFDLYRSRYLELKPK